MKEAEERKMRFMAVVTHELRSPLHGIIGLASVLLGSETDETRLKFTKMISNCASRLLDLVVNIMEITSLASSAPKRSKLVRDPVELSSIIEEVIVLVKSLVDKRGNSLVKKGVELVNEVGFMPIKEADAYKCTQIFYNIITNACKFTTQERVTVSSQVEEGQYVEVNIADSGIGIAQQSLDRIIEPFEQEDSRESRNFEGVGLGLSIAQEVVKRHGGRICVQSELGGGYDAYCAAATDHGRRRRAAAAT